MATHENAALAPVTIQVRFDRVYGKVVCYPVNEHAQRLAAIARTKTLSPEVIRLARGLGLPVDDSGTAEKMLQEWTA